MCCRMTIPMALSALLVFLIAGPAPAANLGVQIKLDPQGMGVLIQEVVYKSPAEMAGLKPNDVITKIDGTMVTNLPEFVRIIREHKAGEKVMLDIVRDGKEQKITVTLGN
jgi:S1-C subfamily serine protease